MCPLSAILSHLLSRWSISQAGWCLLWWIWQIWWFPQRHTGPGWVIGVPPLAGLWHGQLIFGRTEISFMMVKWLQVWMELKMTATTTALTASEAWRDFKGQQDKWISIVFPEPRNKTDPYEFWLVLILKYCINFILYLYCTTLLLCRRKLQYIYYNNI